MTLMELLVLLLVAGVCGALGQALAGSSRGGCLLAIALGFVGAWIGAAIARALDLPPMFVVEIDGNAFPIVWSIAGSALFVAVITLISGGRRRRSGQ
jgi:uncharacterized membrane protein YeaQ/YmgE (transglycosylase-associated protein family)